MRIQTQFLWVNIIGGIAVLGGYIFALLSHPETRSDLWGGVPIPVSYTHLRAHET